MRARACGRAGGFLVALALVAGAAAPAAAQQPDAAAVYDKWCAGCHGADGGGDGAAAAYMLPRPRDFTRALYQIRTTPSGALPTDADMLRVIDEGMPGTAMPGWRELLGERERRALVEHLKSMSPFFEDEAPEPVDFGSAPSSSEERLEQGRELYQQLECWKCHGQRGRGDGPSAPTMQDDDDFPIRPADLTENWLFNGGGTVEDIFRRFRTGMDGTPMPSYSDLIDAGIATEDDLWSLAHYVRSLAPEEAPRLREVIRAEQVEGALPATPDDEAWDDVERFHVPLVGQIIEQPRWFAPTVDGVWVQALHDGDELVLRLSWSDPSQSPDPAWLDWQRLVWQTMQPQEGDPPDPSLPDALAIQFPRAVPAGMERPYFLMGSAADPVYLWYWRSDSARVLEATGRGMARIEPIAGASGVTGAAQWHEGQWRLVVRRALRPAGSAAGADGAAAAGADAAAGTAPARPVAGATDAERIEFPIASAVPIAFFAWDGSTGEAGKRAAISTWYFIYLDEPPSATVYAAPALVALLAAALLGLIVVRARRNAERQRQAGASGRPPVGEPA